MRPNISYETIDRLERLSNRFCDGEVPSHTEGKIKILMETLEQYPDIETLRMTSESETNDSKVDDIPGVDALPVTLPEYEPSPPLSTWERDEYAKIAELDYDEIQ
jgi:hypothetical protein